MPRLEQAELATLFVVLVEAVIVLVFATGIFGYLWLRLRRRSTQASAAEAADDADREGYRGHLQDLVQGLIRRFRTRWSGNPAELHRNAYLRESDTAELVAFQLRYALLHAEIESADATGAAYWERRRAELDALMGCWDEAEKLIRRIEERLRNQQAESVSTEKRRLDEERKTLESKIRQRDLSVQKLEQRVAELEPYKDRFNALHEAAEAQRNAARDLDRAVTAALGQDAAADGARAALQGFREKRSGLERFLDRPDIAPFSERTGETAAPAISAQQVARNRGLAEAVERQGEAQYVRLRNTLQHQQTLIADLKKQVTDAEFQKEQIRQYYTVQIRKLEVSLEESQASLEQFNKEKLRYGRQMRRLMKQIEQQRERETTTEALERAVDRFSAQAFDMQARIQEMDREIAALSEENLRLLEGHEHTDDGKADGEQ